MARFNINDYDGEPYCMHCPTREDAEVFLTHLHVEGRCFYSGRSYADPHAISDSLIYKDNTCYFFNEGTFGNVSMATDYGYHVLKFSDFDWFGYEEFSVGVDEQRELDDFLTQFKLVLLGER